MIRQGEFKRAFHPDQVWEHRGERAVRREAKPRIGSSKARGLCRDNEITGAGKTHAPVYRVFPHNGNHGGIDPRQREDGRVEVGGDCFQIRWSLLNTAFLLGSSLLHGERLRIDSTHPLYRCQNDS